MKKRIMKIFAFALIIALIIAMAIGVSGCGKKAKGNNMEVVNQLIESGQEDVMLFDYFRQVVGTEEMQGYFEIVLYAVVNEEGKMSTEEVRKDVYTDGGLRSEKMESTIVPYAMFEKAMEVAEEYKMNKWQDMDADKLNGIDGCLYVVKLPGGSQYLRISSGSMPDNGMEAFNTVLEALQTEYSAGN